MIHSFVSLSRLSAQRTIQGFVVDTLQNPLSYANILAEPQADLPMAFAISNEQGNYTLQLQSNQTYTITVSYLGYRPQRVTLTPTADMRKDFVLQSATNELDEVTLAYKIPLVIKKDTLIYNTDAFVTGEERKLRDVLKKLPGVEVDREGNVTVQGKKVDKVLVEDKTFFTGNSKLAVNNIPADAVDKVEVLDNYSEVPFLKGLQDSEKMAMNIRLKENKKKFAFGDLEAGGGYKERYVIHPNLFYYSPQTNVNLIADLNNTGVKSFTLRDYIEFEGGFTRLLDDMGSYFSLFRDDFARYLANSDFKESINRFGAFNVRESLSGKTDLNAYILASDTDTETQTQTLNEYFTDTQFMEERNISNQINNTFVIGKATLDYEPSLEEDVSFSSFIKATQNSSNESIYTNNPFQFNQIQTLSASDAFSTRQNIAYSRKFSRKHTATLDANFSYQKDLPQTNWITDQEILEGYIPLATDAIYTIFQQKKSTSANFNALFKHYWVLNNFNHLYTSVGINLFFNDFHSSEEQRLTDGSINSFSTGGFGNRFGYDFRDAFLGVEYKFQRGIFICKPALYYHSYTWNTSQFENRYANHKILLLPQLTSKIEFTNSEKINFKYSLNARFPDSNQLAGNFVIQDFNRVFQGDETLENELYHTFSLNYYKFSLFKNLLLNAGVTYNRKLKNLKTATVFNGIDQLGRVILLNKPENTWTFNGNVSKKINNIKYNLNTGYSYSDFFQPVNDAINQNRSASIYGTASIQTFFNKFPDIELGYTQRYNSYRTALSQSDFQNNELFVNLKYSFLNDFTFKADYSRTDYENKAAGVKTLFDVANASLFYGQEDSSWGFEFSSSNLLNTSFKQQNTFSDFLISDRKTFILPRIILFKIVYKL